MTRIVTFIITMAVCQGLHAQRRITVIAFETGKPLSGVTVKVDSLLKKTDKRGHVDISERFDSISFSHLEYSFEKLRQPELTDTMYLFPKKYALKEVVVTGVGPDLRKSIEKDRERWLSGPHTTQLLTFDFANILDRRGRHDRKQLKRIREILRKFDEK